MRNMVRKPASKVAAEKATDLTTDPGYADLYIPRKKGDPTGQSGEVNTMATGLTADVSGAEAAEVTREVQVQPGRPMKLSAPTKFQNVPVTNNLASAGAGVAPKDPTNMEAYWMGLMSMFDDPIIAEYLQQDDAVPQMVDKRKQIKFGEDTREA